MGRPSVQRSEPRSRSGALLGEEFVILADRMTRSTVNKLMKLQKLDEELPPASRNPAHRQIFHTACPRERKNDATTTYAIRRRFVLVNRES